MKLQWHPLSHSLYRLYGHQECCYWSCTTNWYSSWQHTVPQNLQSFPTRSINWWSHHTINQPHTHSQSTVLLILVHLLHRMPWSLFLDHLPIFWWPIGLSSPPPDHQFETPCIQTTTTMERIKGTQEPKDIHPTRISFQVSNKSPYGSLERPTLPKEGEFMSLLRVMIEMLQELKWRPQFPIFPEHVQSMLTSELWKRMMEIIPLPKYPLNGLPIHSAILGMFTWSAMEYACTSMLWTLISVIFPSHCAWNQSPRSLTSFSIQTILTLTSGFHSDNKITKPATCSKLASGIVITKGVNWLVYFNKATLPRINPIYENPNTYPYGWTADIAKYSCQLGLNCDKTRDEPLRVTDRGHGEWSWLKVE